MAALACLAEYPTKLKSLFESKHITEAGQCITAPRAEFTAEPSKVIEIHRIHFMASSVVR